MNHCKYNKKNFLKTKHYKNTLFYVTYYCAILHVIQIEEDEILLCEFYNKQAEGENTNYQSQ